MRISVHARMLWSALDRARLDDGDARGESDIDRAVAILAVEPRICDADLDAALHELIAHHIVRLRLRPVVCDGAPHARRVALVVMRLPGSAAA